jgi:hypothetical protein
MKHLIVFCTKPGWKMGQSGVTVERKAKDVEEEV